MSGSMPAPSSARCLWAVLCERFLIDEETGNGTAVEILSEVQFSFDLDTDVASLFGQLVEVELVYVCSIVHDDPEDWSGPAELVVSRLDGQAEPQPMVFTSAEGGPMRLTVPAGGEGKVRLNMGALPFLGEGVYCVDVVLGQGDGSVTVGGTRVQVAVV